jgi:3-hydroxyisobutyrate dehydrogenase-like beta-hydroxyacid dehydrogenase
MEKSDVTFIGLGQMGAALVPPFLEAGLTATVWNRSPEKSATLVKSGARLATSFEHAIAASELIIVCLADYETSNALFHVEAIKPLLNGRTVVQFTTGNESEARLGAQWAEQFGVRYLDGAIMDYPTQVGKPECMLLASGERDIWDNWASKLKLLGGRMTYVGEKPEAANLLDGGLLTIMYGSAFGLMQSAAMLAAEGVDIKTLKGALDVFKPVIEATWQRTVDLVDKQDYSGNEASVHVHALGVRSLLKRAKNAGVEHGLLELFASYVDEAAAKGYEKDELPAVYEVFRR